jgi:two-component system, OmpR family, phosphate regulon response regulator PhoB
MKIAVLEDNPAILDLMKIALEMAGHNTYTFNDGASFLESLFSAGSISGTLPYDLVTVDLSLPGSISGLEVISRIQQDISTHQLPIIIITGSGAKEIERAQSLFPTISILHKPFKMNILLQMIDNL